MTVQAPARGADTVNADGFSGQFGQWLLEGATIAQKGASRRVYSDAILCECALGAFAVADGVSTIAGAVDASTRAVMHWRDIIEEAPGDWDAAGVVAALRTVNGRIFAAGRGAGSDSPVGACTFAGIQLARGLSGSSFVFGVGDSEVWLGGADGMRLATVADTVDVASARTPDRKVKRLAAALGAKAVVTPNAESFDAAMDRAALLATDGTDVGAIADHPWFKGEGAVGDIQALLFASLDDAARDDVSIMAVRWREAPA